MSAAAVSQQILALETHLGRALFERSANRVALTAEASDFLPTVQVSLASIESKATAIFARRRVEKIKLIASQLMALSWLPQVLADFERDNPSMRVDLTIDGPQRKADPDLFIRFSDKPEFARHPTWLMSHSHAVFGRPEDIEKVATLQDLLGFTLLDVGPHVMSWPALLGRNFGPMHGRDLKVVTVDTTPLGLVMSSQGLGLAIGNLPVCGPLARSLGLVRCALVPITPGQGNYYLDQPVDRPQRAATIRLERALQAAAQVSMRAMTKDVPDVHS